MSVSHTPLHRSARVWTLLLAAGLATACRLDTPPPTAALEPIYSKDTGELTLLRQDANHNGVPETQSHMRGARIVRIEVDQDEDGRVDRWEHYDADQRLQKVGFSRAHDGREDAWSFADAAGAVVRIEFVAPGTNQVTRTEHYRDAALVGAEEDSDGDGAIDRWETYDRGRLARLAFDASRTGVPTNVLTYLADGSVRAETLKTDLDRRR